MDFLLHTRGDMSIRAGQLREELWPWEKKSESLFGRFQRDRFAEYWCEILYAAEPRRETTTHGRESVTGFCSKTTPASSPCSAGTCRWRSSFSTFLLLCLQVITGAVPKTSGHMHGTVCYTLSVNPPFCLYLVARPCLPTTKPKLARQHSHCFIPAHEVRRRNVHLEISFFNFWVKRFTLRGYNCLVWIIIRESKIEQ